MEDLSESVKYFAHSGVRNYLEDALCGLLAARDTDCNVESSAFMLNYFWHVKNGTHTTLREYDYIGLTPYNRLSFLSSMWKAYQTLERCKITPNEFYSLAQLICPDLPKRILVRTVAALRAEQQDELSPTFSQLFRIFQFHVFFEDFVSALINCLVVEKRHMDLSDKILQNHPSTQLTSSDSVSIPKVSTDSFKSYNCASSQTDFVEEVDHPDCGLCVSTAHFKNVIPDLFVRAAFPLPSKQILRLCARDLIKNETINLDRLFYNLSNESLLAKDAGLPIIVLNET